MSQSTKTLLGIGFFVLIFGVILYSFSAKNKNSTELEESRVSTVPETGSSKKVSPESTTKSDLKAYRNEKMGFEVGYPEGYEVQADKADTDFSIRKIGDIEEAKNLDGVCGFCTLRIQIIPQFIGGSEKGDFKTPEEWVKFQNNIGNSFSKTTIEGKTAYAYSGDKRKGYFIYIKNGAMYDRYDIELKSNDRVAETVLSSFTFTK